jgi:hypothetical protein
LSCLSVTKKIIINIGNERFSNLYFYFLKKGKEKIIHSFRRGAGLLRLFRAFSATLTGRFGMDTVRMGVEGRW